MNGLTPEDIEGFRARGYLAGLPLLSGQEVASFRPEVEKVFAACEPQLHNHILQVHTVLPWAHTLATRAQLLDRIQSLLGPDLLLWKSKCFVKFPGSASVPWHQDMPHWDLLPPVSVTAWIALTPSHPDNGCVRVVPGSHHQGCVSHAVDKGDQSLLTSGLHISPPEDREIHCIELRSGEMSLHDGYILHGSESNLSDELRIGVAFVFIPANARQSGAAHPGVMCVRGDNCARFFPLAPPPLADQEVINRARAIFTNFLDGSAVY